MTPAFKNTLAWLFVGTIAVFIAMNAVSASWSPDGYFPAGNDSYYHARRILDTVEDPGNFFEFDPYIHVPEGSWVTWPWAYDYFVAQLVRGAMAVSGAKEPMAILVYVPVFWCYVNVALVMGIVGSLGLGVGWRTLAGLAFALSAITQSLHGTGLIDHHFIELSFILGSVWAAISWANRPKHIPRAALLGAVLGLAPAFHSALFILQAPALLCLVVAWVKWGELPTRPTGMFCLSLVVTTLLTLLGSEPFWEGFFEYYLLSWFHLYVACASALAAAWMAASRFSVARLIALIALGICAGAPLIARVVDISAFFDRSAPRIDTIQETQTPLDAMRHASPAWLRSHYTYLFLLAPATLLYCVFAVLRPRQGRWLVYGAYGLLCLPLFFLQLRFQYFGLIYLITGPLLAGWWLAHRWPRARHGITAAVVVLFVFAFYFPVVERWNPNLTLGLDARYSSTLRALLVLGEVCAEDPGVVLARNDDGNYIRFHSDCSIIANNFLLTEQHGQKIRELDRVMALTPDELRATRPDIRYVLASFEITEARVADIGTRPMRSSELRSHNEARFPLTTTLLFASPDELEGYELLHDYRMRWDDDESVSLVRLFRVLRPDELAIEAKPARVE